MKTQDLKYVQMKLNMETKVGGVQRRSDTVDLCSFANEGTLRRVLIMFLAHDQLIHVVRGSLVMSCARNVIRTPRRVC